MNLKAYMPIIALCAVTFALSFAVGLWWELSQQKEWQTTAYSATDDTKTIAKHTTDKEKSDRKSKTGKEPNKTDDDKKDQPTEAPKSEEDSQTPPVEGTPEPSVVPSISPAETPANAIRLRGGMKQMDLNNLSEEQRARLLEARQKALETAARARAQAVSRMEISGDSESSIITDESPPDGAVILEEPEN